MDKVRNAAGREMTCSREDLPIRRVREYATRTRHSRDKPEQMDAQTIRITFIGGGNMAQAMLGGLLKRGVQPANMVWPPTRSCSFHVQ
jgi:hypothetical protein